MDTDSIQNLVLSYIYSIYTIKCIIHLKMQLHTTSITLLSSLTYKIALTVLRQKLRLLTSVCRLVLVLF